VLNPTRMASFLEEKIAAIGTSACPPYHLAIVVGGTSAEYALKTAKYASARYLDTLPTEGRCSRTGPRPGPGAVRSGDHQEDRDRGPVRRQVLLPRRTGNPAAAAWRVLPGCDRGVLLGRRQAVGKITAEGVFLEQLETDPAQYLPDPTSVTADAAEVVSIDLNRQCRKSAQNLRNIRLRRGFR